jgi:hypothetical protein
MRALALSVALSTLVGLSSAYGQDKAAEADSVREQIQALQQRLIDLEKGDQAKRRITEIDPGKPRTRDHEGTGMLRAYDLNDLFALVPQYPAKHPSDIDGREELLFPAPANGPSGLTGTGGGFGGGMGGGGFFQVGSGQTSAIGGMQASIAELINVIQSSTPGPWLEIDGEGGTITTIGTTLLVRASLENHQQIERLLEVLRNTWGSLKLVNLEIDWLWVTEEELRTVAPIVPESAVRTVEGESLESLRESQGQDGRPAGRSAQVTCYNGQTVNVQSLKQSLSVTSVTPITGANTLGYTPQVRGLDHGTAAQVHPLVSRSGKFVVLDFHSRVNEVEPGDVETYDAVRPYLDRPTLVTHRLSTALRVPVGVPSLVGGMTHSELEMDPGYTLCVFVRANVEDMMEAAADEAVEEATREKVDVEESGEAEAGAARRSGVRGARKRLDRQGRLRDEFENERALDSIRQQLEERRKELLDPEEKVLDLKELMEKYETEGASVELRNEVERLKDELVRERDHLLEKEQRLLESTKDNSPGDSP